MHTALPRRRLPIGLQSFAKLREQDCSYVDKTGLAIDLIESGSAFFLSRPRRFGKSLLLDTLRELFEGNQALFTGLAAETRWDWSRRYPVIRISFGGGVTHTASQFGYRIESNLQANRTALGTPRPPSLPLDDVAGDLMDLIAQAHAARRARGGADRRIRQAHPRQYRPARAGQGDARGAEEPVFGAEGR